MKAVKFNRINTQAIFAIFSLLLIISPVLGQTPFSGAPISVNQSSDYKSETTASEDFSNSDSPSYLENLTEEESRLLTLGLLPVYYPSLKQCLEQKEPFTGSKGGLKASIDLCKSYYPLANGHFSRNFGNPQKMLEWARRTEKDEKLCKLVLASKAGDVLLTGPIKEEDINKNLICLMTKGPYYHASIVVESTPPVIIESVGVTGSISDPYSNKVRMSMWYEELNYYCFVKLVRPTEKKSDKEAQEIINKALGYSYLQLGRPYDYSFTDSDGSSAFYCSELVSKAYESGGLDIANKNAERDKIVVAVHEVIDGLKPKDKVKLSDDIVNFALRYIENPDFDMLQDFIVNTIVPSCEVFSEIFPDEKSLVKLNNVINKVRDGDAFDNFSKASGDYKAKKAAGKFDAKFGIGFLREKTAQVGIAAGFLKDMNNLANDAGTNLQETLILTTKILLPLYQNLGTYGEILSDLGKNGVQIPQGVQTMLEIIDWSVEKREEIRKWPIIGEPLSQLMPGSGNGKIRTDFTSPSDIGYGASDFSYTWP
jgi:uncharacterized protein YycO